MSRWRPPNPDGPGSPHITRAGFDRLKAEYEQLWHQRRPEVVRALAAAAAEGDRSENAEYIYRKKELREIDRRVEYLQRRLPAFRVVETVPADQGRVYFGAWVTLADEDGAEKSYRIVGGDEAGAAPGYISIDSPLAKALLKKPQGELVKIALPKGEAEWQIVALRYEA